MATLDKQHLFTIVVVLVIVLIAPTIIGQYSDARQFESNSKAVYQSAIIE